MCIICAPTVSLANAAGDVQGSKGRAGKMLLHSFDIRSYVCILLHSIDQSLAKSVPYLSVFVQVSTFTMHTTLVDYTLCCLETLWIAAMARFWNDLTFKLINRECMSACTTPGQCDVCCHLSVSVQVSTLTVRSGLCIPPWSTTHCVVLRHCG